MRATYENSDSNEMLVHLSICTCVLAKRDIHNMGFIGRDVSGFIKETREMLTWNRLKPHQASRIERTIAAVEATQLRRTR